MRSLLFAAPLLLTALLAGCSQQTSTMPAAEVEAHRAKFLQTAEPEGALGILAARAVLQGKPADDAHDHDHADHDHEGHDHDAHDDHEGHDHEAHDGHDHVGHDHDAHDHEHAHETEPQEIVVFGLIGGVNNPWEQGKAAFMIVDTESKDAHDHGHDHDGHAHDHDDHDHADHKHAHAEDHDCPFCARGKSGTKSLAIVQFLDEKGEILPVDSRELFQLKEQQTVVVKGPAKLDGLGNLIITAESLFVRP